MAARERIERAREAVEARGGLSVLTPSPHPQLPSGPGSRSFQVDNLNKANNSKLHQNTIQGATRAWEEAPGPGSHPRAEDPAVLVMGHGRTQQAPRPYCLKSPAPRMAAFTLAIPAAQLGPGYQWEHRDPSSTSTGSSRHNGGAASLPSGLGSLPLTAAPRVRVGAGGGAPQGSWPPLAAQQTLMIPETRLGAESGAR